MSTLILALDILIGFCVVFGVLAAFQIVMETKRWGQK